MIEINAYLFWKKILLSFITFSSRPVVCRAFELSNRLTSLIASSIVIVLKEKHSRMCFILNNCFQSSLVYAFWQRIKFSNLGILRSIITFEKKSFSFIATSSSFVIRVSSSSASFILSEDCILFDKKDLPVFQSHLFSLINSLNIFE